MTGIIIKGNKEEVRKILYNLVKKYGKNIKLIDVIKKYNKEDLVLV